MRAGLIARYVTRTCKRPARATFAHIMPCERRSVSIQGRYMFDSIIARPNRATPLCEQDEFLLLCQKNSAASVERHIKLFKLRDKVTVKRDDSINIWSIMSTDTASLSSVVRDIDNDASDIDSIVFFDPRTPR